MVFHDGAGVGAEAFILPAESEYCMRETIDVFPDKHRQRLDYVQA